MAVADAAAGIDHEQRVVHVDAGALKAVVHDQEIAAAADQQPRAGSAVGVTATWRMRGQQQRLVADTVAALSRPASTRCGSAGSCRHGRATGCPASVPARRAAAASAIATGVLPAPPTVKLPTQSTGASTFSRRAPQHAAARPPLP